MLPYLRTFWRAMGLLLTEPLGLIVPLALMLVVFEAPQMRDMFDGMVGVGADGAISNAWWHWMGYPVAALVLTFVSWFWTRAALTEAASFPARLALRRASRWGWRKSRVAAVLSRRSGRAWALWGDAGWLARSNAAPAMQAPRRVAARTPPSICFVVLCAPIFLAPDSPAAQSGAIAAVLVLVGTVLRHRLTGPGRPVPCWMWWTRTTGLFASAPFGWPAAVLLVAAAVACVVVLAVRPEWPDHDLHAPTTVVAAIAALTTLLAVLVAVIRDAVALLLFLPWWFARRTGSTLAIPFPGVGAFIAAAIDPPRRTVLRGLTDGLAAVLVLVWLMSAPFEELATRRHWMRLAAPLATAAERHCEPGPAGAMARPCLTAAVRSFAAQAKRRDPAAHEHPAIIVAAEGGASRAAVWTLSAFRYLDHETQGRFGRSLFAISSVSGGSLGSVTYVEALHAFGRPEGGLDWADRRATNGLDRLATADLLNVAAGTLFLNDMLARVSPWAAERLGLPDRGLALERTFERHWRWDAGFKISQRRAEGGLIELYGDTSSPAQPSLPQLFLNGTDVKSGRRVITASVRFEPSDFPSSDDLLFLTGHDVPAATAVLNSARFPFISPPARYRVAGDPDTRQLFDGGVFENYGARTAQELAAAVAAISAHDRLDLVPIVVVISNDADSARAEQETDSNGNEVPLLVNSAVSCAWTWPQASKEREKMESDRNPRTQLVPEGSAIVLGLNNVRGAHGLDALHALRQALCTADSPRMFHIALPRVLDPKREAAPMNWTQFPRARDFLLAGGFEAAFTQAQAASLSKLLTSLANGGLQEAVALPSR